MTGNNDADGPYLLLWLEKRHPGLEAGHQRVAGVGPDRAELALAHAAQVVMPPHGVGVHKHPRIKDAFALRKDALSKTAGTAPKTVESPELQLALDQIERLKSTCERLEAENQRLLEQFVTWAYNAHTRGLDEAFLSRPLPPVNRQQTPLKRVRPSTQNSSGRE